MTTAKTHSPASRWLAELVTARPRLVLLGALLLTLALAPLTLKLRLDTDVYDLFPQDKPAAAAFARYSKAFVEEPVVIVLVESQEPGKLDGFMDGFADALRKSPRIVEVRHRLTGEAARFFRDHLLAFLDDSELAVLRQRTEPAAMRAQLQRLRGLLSAPGGSALAPILTADPFELLPLVQKRLGGGVSIDASSGLFKSADGRAALLYLRPRDPATAYESTRALLEEIGTIAAAQGAHVTDGTFGGAGIEVSFTGPSIYALHYRDWLHRDMTISTVLSVTSVLVLFGLFFRALRVLPLVGLPLVVGLFWTGAVAVALFHRVNAVSLAFGTILISIGIDLPIQLYNRLREELASKAPHEALHRTIERFAGPAVLATLGPAAVFLACTISRFRGLRELGALSAIGLVVNCIAMLTIFPSLLAALPSRLWGGQPRTTGAGFFHALGRLAVRRPRTILGVAAFVFCAALPFALGVRFDRHLFAQPPMMPPARVQAELERRFGQRDYSAIAYYEAHDNNLSADELDEDALQHSDRWLEAARRLEQAKLVRGYQSLSLLVPSVATQRERYERLRAMDGPARAAEATTMLTELGFDPEAFRPFLAQLGGSFSPIRVRDLRSELDFLVRLHLHRDKGESRVATYLYPVEGAREDESLRVIVAVADGPAGGVVTGRPLLEPTLRQAAEHDLARATGLAAVLVVALVFLHHRRWRPSLAILLPLSLAWVLFGAVLTLFHIPLNLYNLLAVPLVIGYGIDDHVFLLARFEEGHDVGEALASTGRAVVVTSLATMAGFLPIAFARFPALRLLGVSGALAVGLCLLAAFAVLPALLVLLVGPSLEPQPKPSPKPSKEA